MNKYKTKNTTCIVYKEVKNRKGEVVLKVVGYLTEKHEEKGMDIQLDMQGYKVVAI